MEQEKIPFAIRLLRSFCPLHLLEEIEGDLIQKYEQDLKLYGERKAKRKLLWNVIRFFRLAILMRNKFTVYIKFMPMIKNYFLTAWRSFLKRKTVTLINIIGISFAISFLLLTCLFILDELSFDNFHHNKNFIYRVDFSVLRNGDPDLSERSTSLPLPFAHTLKAEVAGIEYVTRFDSRNNYLLINKDKYLEDVHYVDADFLKMFTLQLIEGARQSQLKNLTDIFISDEKAIKLFGKASVLGKRIDIDNTSYIVSGVFKKFPNNSSLNPEIIIRYENFPPFKKQHDDWNAYYSPVFVQLGKTTTRQSIEKASQLFCSKHIYNNSRAKNETSLVYTNLNNIHFDSEVPWLNVSNVKYSYILGGITFIVLFVACINYILLSLAGSVSRAKEIGVRKVIGASRSMIQFQFWGESLTIIAIALPISIVSLHLILPQFNALMHREIYLFQWSLFRWVSILGTVMITVGILAGAYPALVLSNFMPEKILKRNANGKFKAKFSGALIVFQFASCLTLLICSLIMFNQMRMVQTRDLGFNKEQVVLVDLSNNLGVSGKTILKNFRTELANQTGIMMISGISSDFGEIPGSSSRQDSTGKITTEYYCAVDYDFFELLKIPLVEGRYFSKEFPSDSLFHYIVNESFAKQTGGLPAVGKKIMFNPNSEVVGVVKDFNFQSLTQEIKPFAFQLGKHFNYGKILIKISPENIPSSIKKIEQCWNKVVGDGPVKYSFLDDQINEQYERYTQWIKVISISALLSIAVAGLGLLGIINLSVANRTKEIGIRKVLGATVFSLILLFSKQYIRLIVVAFILAIPVANYFSTAWLQDFIYKTTVGFGEFAVPFFITLFFALLVMWSSIIKKAKTNPVEAIRYE